MNYISLAIEIVLDNILSVGEQKLAEYYMHRALVYETMGMLS